MNVSTKQSEAALSCQECHMVIPPDVALTAEGADLVDYHCGADCYQSFIAKARSESINDAMILASPLL